MKNNKTWNKSRRKFLRRLVEASAGIALTQLLDVPPAEAQLGSPTLVNPSEIRYRDKEKKLRGVVEMTSGNYQIPNVGTKPLRQFRGWDPAKPAPPPKKTMGPGPTLRARVGDKVEIAVLNKIDDKMFSYTFDTTSPPGKSSFGCDVSGSAYPAGDIFPNCFHGSSTGNIHFHGTHTNPDGLGDNVLVEILPQPNQRDWTKVFDEVYSSPQCPTMWHQLPDSYTTEQKRLMTQHDTDAAAAAKKNKLPPPDPLEPTNQKLIDAHLWPQYIMGAYPNCFELPDYATGKYKAGQAPGTHWYHAHKHGSTSLHILNGLAGAFVIESNAPGGYDHFIRDFYKWGDSYGDHEKILVFQHVDPDQNMLRGPHAVQTIVVNGLLTPTIKMRPGEVQLWRFVNATEGSVGSGSGIIYPDIFQATGFQFRQTAMDGVQFSPRNYTDQPMLNGKVPNASKPKANPGLMLFAGNRADVLVQAPTPTNNKPSTFTFTSNGATRFFVEVAGDPVNLQQPFPDQWPELPAYLQPLKKPGPNDVPNPNSPVQFQWDRGPGRQSGTGTPPHFMINGKQFEQDGPHIDQCMPLDGRQDWILENWTTIPHPFHIHINPFQIIEIDTPNSSGGYSTYTPPDDKNKWWQDTIAIPPAAVNGTTTLPGKITIRHTFVDFVGTYVLHCHILGHEDRGMMQLVRVVPASSYSPEKCQENIPQHH